MKSLTNAISPKNSKTAELVGQVGKLPYSQAHASLYYAFDVEE